MTLRLPLHLLTLTTVAAACSSQTAHHPAFEPGLALPRHSHAPSDPVPAWSTDLSPPAPLPQDSPAFEGPETGFFIRAFGQYQAVGGDFDGETALAGPGIALVVPKVDPGIGFGVGLGIRGENLSLELNYRRTNHDSTILGAPFDVTLQSVNLDFKGYFLDNSRIQPSILLGLGFPWLTVEDGAFNSSGSSAGDARFTGLTADVGGGVTYYPSSRVGISVDAGYRFVSFDHASGGEVSGPIDDSIDAGGFFVTLGTTFTF